MSLLGVSHPNASCARCFARGRPAIILDTSMVRVTGRVFGLPITDPSRRSTLFRQDLERLTDAKHPLEFKFALLDLGATMYRPHSTQHETCPICNYCAFNQKPTKPQRLKTSKATTKYLNVRKHSSIAEHR